MFPTWVNDDDVDTVVTERVVSVRTRDFWKYWKGRGRKYLRNVYMCIDRVSGSHNKFKKARLASRSRALFMVFYPVGNIFRNTRRQRENMAPNVHILIHICVQFRNILYRTLGINLTGKSTSFHIHRFDTRSTAGQRVLGRSMPRRTAPRRAATLTSRCGAKWPHHIYGSRSKIQQEHSFEIPDDVF